MRDPRTGEELDFDIDRNVYRAMGELKWDPNEGEMHEFDGMVNRIYKVRTTLLDDLILQAVIVELERRGYTVISPDSPT
jgi:hypothetical protein